MWRYLCAHMCKGQWSKSFLYCSPSLSFFGGVKVSFWTWLSSVQLDKLVNEHLMSSHLHVLPLILIQGTHAKPLCLDFYIGSGNSNSGSAGTVWVGPSLQSYFNQALQLPLISSLFPLSLLLSTFHQPCIAWNSPTFLIVPRIHAPSDFSISLYAFTKQDGYSF